MSTFNIIGDQTELATRISALAGNATKVQNEIHLLAVSTLDHIRQHGDFTLALRLFNALPNGQRVKGLAVWYRHFSNKALSFNYDKKAGWGCKIAKGWSADDFNIEGAIKTSYGDLTNERNPTTMSIEQVLRMLKRTANKTGNNADGSPLVDPKARDLCAKLYVAGTGMIGLAEALGV